MEPNSATLTVTKSVSANLDKALVSQGTVIKIGSVSTGPDLVHPNTS